MKDFETFHAHNPEVLRLFIRFALETIPEQIQYMLDSYIGQAKSDDAKLRELIRNAK